MWLSNRASNVVCQTSVCLRNWSSVWAWMHPIYRSILLSMTLIRLRLLVKSFWNVCWSKLATNLAREIVCQRSVQLFALCHAINEDMA